MSCVNYNINKKICTQHSETVENLVAGCIKLTRHSKALMILAVALAKQQELVGQAAIWYEQQWD